MSGQTAKTAGERCYEIAETVWKTPPDRIDRPAVLQMRRELTSLVAGHYRNDDGHEVEVHNPVHVALAECAECAFIVTIRYSSGPRCGEVERIPLFGDDGFFGGDKQPRYKRDQAKA